MSNGILLPRIGILASLVANAPALPVDGVNLDAELTDMTGWTVSPGVDDIPVNTSAQSAEGARSFVGNIGPNSGAYQDIALNAEQIVAAGTGTAFIEVRWAQRGQVVTHNANCYVDFYDGAPGSLISSGKYTDRVGAEGRWDQRSTGYVLMPTNTQTIRLFMEFGVSNGGSPTGAYIDDIRITIRQVEIEDISQTNHDFELGDSTNWVGSDGVANTALTGKQGTWFGRQTAGFASTDSQYIDHAVPANWQTDVDAGIVDMTLDFLIGGDSEGIEYEARTRKLLSFRNAGDTEISTATAMEQFRPLSAELKNLGMSRLCSQPIAVPALTRTIRTTSTHSHGGGNPSNWRLDDFNVNLIRDGVTPFLAGDYAITNGSFETNSGNDTIPTGWTSGAPPDIGTSGGGAFRARNNISTGARTGSFVLWHSIATIDAYAWQSVNIDPLDEALIDTGTVVCRQSLYAQQTAGGSGDTLQIITQAYDGANGTGTEILDVRNGTQTFSNGSWQLYQVQNTLPTGTRSVRYTIRSVGLSVDVAIDDVEQVLFLP